MPQRISSLADRGVHRLQELVINTAMENTIERALDGLADFFDSKQTRAAVVARRLLGTSHSGDASLTDQLIRERRRKTRLDGSINGSLAETAWGLRELLQLGCGRDHAGLHRMLGFVLSRQDKPGRFGEGCSDRRHEIAHCNHYLSGFFSPGGADEPQAPLALPTGAVITTEFGARFAASCVALRAVLGTGEEKREAIKKHVESLLLLASRWYDLGEFPKSMDVVFSATGALGAAPRAYRDEVATVIDNVVHLQKDDGTWPDVSLFHALDGLQSSPNEKAVAACRSATGALLAVQQPDGSFDETHNEEFALIAVRALKPLANSAGKPIKRRKHFPIAAKPRSQTS